MKPSFAILHGPNLNHLGQREPEIYGSTTLAALDAQLATVASAEGVALTTFQSNHEGALIDQLYALAQAGCAGVVFNPGAFTHTSVALRDAIAGTRLRVIEVHLSNVAAREDFRHHSYLAPVCVGTISGLGLGGYHAALKWLIDQPA